MKFSDRVLSLFGLMRWNVLQRLIEEIDAKRVIEVGVAEGFTAKYVLNNNRELEYYGVDPYEGDRAFQYPIAEKLFYGYGVRAPLLRMNSLEASKLFSNGCFDIVFIDADHSYNAVRADILAWLPKVRYGGYICGHDYDQEGVRKAVIEVLGVNIQNSFDNMWVFKK